MKGKAFVVGATLGVLPAALLTPRSSTVAALAQSRHSTPAQRSAPTQPPPLRGFVDLHTHPMANLAFSGKLFYGGVDVGSLLPSDPDCNQYVRASSEEEALGHDGSTHGNSFTSKCGDWLRSALVHGLQQNVSAGNLHAADPSENAYGYPDFCEWPKWNDVLHQKMWVDWIHRAWQGGLRVMVALAQNNKTLADMVRGPGDTIPDDDKASADLQIVEIKSFVARHPDFMEVANSSSDVYRIVSANKLAVVVGIEVDHIGNFQVALQIGGVLVPDPVPPSDAAVRAEIDRLYGEGVRYIFPIHLLDNAFGGAAAYESLFDISNVREDGQGWALACADWSNPHDTALKAWPQGFTYANQGLFSDINGAEVAKLDLVVASISSPQCGSAGQKNTLGLTRSGTIAIMEMMRLGMLIDIDHMSQAAADSALAIANHFGYPVNSGHSGVRGAFPAMYTERSLRPDQYAQIGRLHGMAGVGSSGFDAKQWLALYNKVYAAMGAGNIVGGFGTDMSGLQLAMPPRLAHVEPGPDAQNYQQCVDQCSQSYLECTHPGPGRNLVSTHCGDSLKACVKTCKVQFANRFIEVAGSSLKYDSTSFPASRDGGRTWDYNKEGVAHYGMLWDFLQDVRSLPGGADMVDNHFMNGADYFYQTWRLAETRAPNVK